MNDRVISAYKNYTPLSKVEWNASYDNIPRGWFELSRLVPADRIEFVQGYWLSKLPYTPHLSRALARFFASLDGIDVFLVGDSAHIVYSLADHSTFYVGEPPNIPHLDLGIKLPDDYIKFFSIHNGFYRYMDTGLIRFQQLSETWSEVQDKVALGELKDGSHLIDPKCLIPFYHYKDLDVYQCFYTSWYPAIGMGNVFVSLREGFISPSKQKQDLAFPTFGDWLIYYLESL